MCQQGLSPRLHLTPFSSISLSPLSPPPSQLVASSFVFEIRVFVDEHAAVLS